MVASSDVQQGHSEVRQHRGSLPREPHSTWREQEEAVAADPPHDPSDTFLCDTHSAYKTQ